MRNKINDLCGLTILEIIISTLIFAMVISGLVNLFVAAKRLSRHTRSRIQATELGKLFLEPLQMQVSQDNWNTSCLGAGNCSNFSQTLSGITYNASYNITNVAGTTLRRAQVNLTWNEPE